MGHNLHPSRACFLACALYCWPGYRDISSPERHPGNVMILKAQCCWACGRRLKGTLDGCCVFVDTKSRNHHGFGVSYPSWSTFTVFVFLHF